ncbi:MFS transporter [Devosia sp. 1566]|uniref:MFS transporter n=1 Tax=Devosia sp. 1566 TaxID=2499144 RepID=UPI0013E38BC5|nr:MFS transporter [Devosia sp. 1566]
MAFYAYYFALYAQVAIGITFMPLWLKSGGLTVQEIGVCLALASALAVVVNPVVGGAADRTRSNKAILFGLVVLATLASAALLAANGPLIVAGVYLILRFVSAPLIPLSESILIANLATYRLEFGRVRAWGSASVVVTTLLCGYLVDWSGPTVILLVLILVLALQAGLSSALPGRGDGAAIGPISTAAIAKALRNRSFLLLIGSAAISQACHGLFYAYSTFRWLGAGYSTFEIGMFWTIGVAAEIIAFAFASRITTRLTPGMIISIGCLAGVLRWGTFGYSTDILPTLLMQLLQGATLGLTQVGVAAYMRRHVAPHFLASATGSYAAAGGLLGSVFILVGGQLYASGSGSVFLFASALCAFGLVAALCMIRLEKRSAVVPA